MHCMRSVESRKRRTAAAVNSMMPPITMCMYSGMLIPAHSQASAHPWVAPQLSRRAGTGLRHAAAGATPRDESARARGRTEEL